MSYFGASENNQSLVGLLGVREVKVYDTLNGSNLDVYGGVLQGKGVSITDYTNKDNIIFAFHDLGYSLFVCEPASAPASVVDPDSTNIEPNTIYVFKENTVSLAGFTYQRGEGYLSNIGTTANSLEELRLSGDLIYSESIAGIYDLVSLSKGLSFRYDTFIGGTIDSNKDILMVMENAYLETTIDNTTATATVSNVVYDGQTIEFAVPSAVLSGVIEESIEGFFNYGDEVSSGEKRPILDDENIIITDKGIGIVDVINNTGSSVFVTINWVL